jgi:hypothetical protein
MDVYLIPVGTDRYELYCEDNGDIDTIVDAEPASGWFASTYQKFRAALAKAEEDRQTGRTGAHEGPRTWTERMTDRAMCLVAEKIAEQRLLWRLRSETDVQLFYPDDMTGDRAWVTTRSMLQSEADRHRKWTIIDGIIFAVTTPVLFMVPGPNVVAYYFGFRMVGHYLSRRGAKHGLMEVRWTKCPSAQLSQLRQAIAMRSEEREVQVHRVAAELRLRHLATFFERTCVHPA